MNALDRWYRRPSMQIADRRALKAKEDWESLGTLARESHRPIEGRSVAVPRIIGQIGEQEVRRAELQREQAEKARDFLKKIGGQVIGGVDDFRQNYESMKEADTIGADKYFHCKANCEATKRGPAGEIVANVISNGRELTDLIDPRKGQNFEDMHADQSANRRGRRGGTNRPEQSCSETCAIHRPRALNPRYP